jgi:hypothetical protein
MHERLETKCFYRTAQNLEPNPINVGKEKSQANFFGNETEGSAAAEVMPCREPLV